MKSADRSLEVTARREAARKAANCGSIPRPEKKPCIWDHVDFMEWESWRDLSLSPPAGEERFGNRFEKRGTTKMIWLITHGTNGYLTLDDSGTVLGAIASPAYTT